MMFAPAVKQRYARRLARMQIRDMTKNLDPIHSLWNSRDERGFRKTWADCMDAACREPKHKREHMQVTCDAYN